MRALQLDILPSLVGLPYRDLGRDRTGVDCWGMIVLGFWEAAGIALPSYAGDYLGADEMAEISGLIGQAKQLATWSPVPIGQHRPLDVAVFRRGRFDAHVGLVAEPSRELMLHAAAGRGSRMDRWTGALWASRLTGIYRHIDLSGGPS